MGERHPKKVRCQQSLHELTFLKAHIQLVSATVGAYFANNSLHKKYQAVCVFDYFSNSLLYASDMQITVIVFVVEVGEELQPLFSKVSPAEAASPLFMAS